MDERRGKRAVIVLSSSSEEENTDCDDSSQSDTSEIDDEDEDEEDRDEASESDDCDVDDESLSEKVVSLLLQGFYFYQMKLTFNNDVSNRSRLVNFVFDFAGRKDIDSLKLNECKAYLRKHGLRLAGNRAVCIARIKEHWR